VLGLIGIYICFLLVRFTFGEGFAAGDKKEKAAKIPIHWISLNLSEKNTHKFSPLLTVL